MKSALSIAACSRFLFPGSLVVLLMCGCSKHEDDCPAPEDNDDQGATRTFVASDAQNTLTDERPAAALYRSPDEIEGDTDGDGISDDGDDEADGEGNKKGRTQH